MMNYIPVNSKIFSKTFVIYTLIYTQGGLSQRLYFKETEKYLE